MKPTPGWGVIDLETTTRTGYGRKADPFDKDNWVVMAGWCDRSDQTPTGRRYQKHRQSELGLDFVKLLSKCNLLVGVNIKFDLLYLLRDEDTYAHWQEWVAGGGNVFDLQVAEYILQGQEQGSHMLSMDDFAVFYGEDTKVDEVKLLWEAGVPTEEIDPDLLARYLLGEDLKNPVSGAVTGRREGDIGNTRNIFLKQVARVKAAGQSRVVMVNMGSLLCTIEMERNGMRVDKELGLVMAEELAHQLADARGELTQYLPEGVPFDFNFSNRYHLSPLIFGGTVQYDAYEWDLKAGGVTNTQPPEGEGVYVQNDVVCYVMNDGTFLPKAEVDKHTEGGTLEINAEKFKGGKNAGEYKTQKVKGDDLSKPKGRACKLRFSFPGYTKPEKAWESATPGLYSVAAEVIEELTQFTDIPFLKKLGEVVAIAKNLSTYFIVEDDKKPGTYKGMLTMVRDNGIVHHGLNHTSTVTGRFSASKPNFQNLPKGQKSRVKELFVSRFPNGEIAQSDFSSLEVYAQAILTGCKQLIADLQGGLDLHCVRLAAKEHMPYEEVLKLAKGYKTTAADGSVIHHAAVPEWDYKRTGAKVYSFQVAYGAGDKTIAKATGMAVEEVAALRAAESERYPEIDKFFAELEQRIVDAAVPIQHFVNHPCNPLVKVQLRRSQVSAPCGTLYTFRSNPSMEFMFKRGILQSFSPTERKNFIVQGTGALWMKAAMWLMVRAWYERRNFGGRSLLVNTVHDAAYSDNAPEVKQQAAELMQACMEGASRLIEQYLNWRIPLPVPSDTVLGANMGEENPCQWDGFRDNVTAQLNDLTSKYLNNHSPSWLKETK